MTKISKRTAQKIAKITKIEITRAKKAKARISKRQLCRKNAKNKQIDKADVREEEDRWWEL
jgi:hypothetical protein